MASCELNGELCRICLEDGAKFPIFEKSEATGESIAHKLLTFINQKIEDTEGYPRSICLKCNSAVDLICDFVNKLQDSNNTLLKGLQNIKQEQDSYSDVDYYDESFIEEVKVFDERNSIKLETHFNDSCLKDNLAKLLKQKAITIKVEPKEIKKTLRPTKKPKNRTNNIASSILEGTFEWTGSEWCVSSTTITKIKPKKKKDKTKQSCNNNIKEKVKQVKVKREPAIKIPKVSEPNRIKLCDICGKTLKQIDSLRSHKHTHDEAVEVPCSECGKICKSRAHLKNHINHIHREKKFICAICGAGFPVHHRLTHHTKRVHEKHLYPQKLHPCSYCPKSFKAKTSAEVHERSVHTGLRPAVCTICDASFFHNDYLKQHMRLHTGETPFKCPVCNRGYAQRGNMKSHMHHNHTLSQLTGEQLASIPPSLLKYLKP